MRHNKILGAAIVAALSMGGGTAQAGELKLIEIGDATVTAPPTMPIELFPADTPTAIPPLPDGAGPDFFEVEYTVSSLTAAVTDSFTVTYTLIGGTWTTTQPQAGGLAVNGNADFPTTFLSVTDNTVSFLIKTSEASDADKAKLEKDDPLSIVLKGFQVEVDKTAFSSVDAKVELQIDLSGIDSLTDTQMATLVSSGNGTKVIFTEGDDNNVKVDVGVAGKKFTRPTVDPLAAVGVNAAILGTIDINYPDPANPLKNYTLTNSWDFNGADGINNGTFKITIGPFAASTQANAVFIDLDNNNCMYDAGDPKATVSANETTANWGTLSKAQLVSIFGASRNICVTVPANNTRTINAQDDPPTASLTLKYQHRPDAILPYSGALRQIKRNGVICTVYNVPDDQAIDEAYIRITNRSGRSGNFLRGTLRKSDGTNVFANADLLAVKGLTKLNNNATLVLGPDKLRQLADEAGYTNDPTNRWKRGVLEITSDLDQMEVFDLLRYGDVLTNFSLAASGPTCQN